MSPTTALDDSTDICPGPCNRAWEAAERRHHNTGQTHDLQPVPGRPLWCHDCTNTITENLRAIPDLAAHLGSGPLATPPTEIGRLSKADVHVSPSPSYDLFDEVNRWAIDLEDHLRARLGHPLPDTSRYLGRSIAYLLGHLSPLLSLDPDGIEAGMSAKSWQRRLTNATGTQRLIHRIPGECPRAKCGKRGMMRRHDGDDLVKCTACGACWDVDHWRFLARAATQGATA